MDTSATLTTIISIFLLLLAGYGMKRAGILKPTDASVVNNIIIYLTMPAFIFVYTHNMPLTSAMIKAPILGFVMEMVVMGAAYLAARAMKLDRKTTGALMLAAAFGNTGFLGYPMVSAAFHGNKHAMLTAVMFDQFGMALVLNSVGVAVAAGFSGKKCGLKHSIVEFIKTPLFPTTILALALRTVPIPDIITKTLGFLAGGTVPLAMVSIGLSLSGRSISKYPLALGVGSILKMVALPVLMFLTLPLIGVTGAIKHVAVLEGAVPTAVMAGVIAGRYDANEEFVACSIFFMTLLSIIVLPSVLVLLK